MPSLSLLVSYIMKKSNEGGKVDEVGKKAVYLKPYKTKYMLRSCTKFNNSKRWQQKYSYPKEIAFHFIFDILLNEKGWYELYISWQNSYPFLHLICNLNNTYHNIWYHNIYIYIYIYIYQIQKRQKKYTYATSASILLNRISIQN